MKALDIPTFLLGFTWAISAFTFAKAAQHTYMCWNRSGRISAYIAMIWLEWATCLSVALASWMYLEGRIRPSIGYFFGMLVLWVIEVQCITQIIINRVSLIMFNPRRVKMLKWGVATFIGLINISVFCVWLPAHLQANPTAMRANMIWDRTEKVIFLVLELCLNSYFMWLIRSELVSNGLTKYNTLFKFNVAMVLFSVSLDGVLVGVMSLPNDLLYIQFHALFFQIKLLIEMTIAELIAKIARTNSGRGNRTDLEEHHDEQHEARFTCAISWQQCFGLDTARRPIGEALYQREDDDGKVRIEDLQRIEAARSGTVSRNGRVFRSSERLGSTTSTATRVDWPAGSSGAEKQWDAETCENCGGRYRGRPEASRHCMDGSRSQLRRHSTR